jgi:hypothetical protein
MSTFRPIVVVAAAAIATSSVQAQMKPGRWETTSKMEMSGMPMAMPATTVTICHRASDDPGVPPLPEDMKNDCKIGDLKTDGGTQSWTMSCTGENKMTGKGSMTYQGASYSGTIDMRMDMPGEAPMTMKQTVTGRRLGDC